MRSSFRHRRRLRTHRSSCKHHCPYKTHRSVRTCSQRACRRNLSYKDCCHCTQPALRQSTDRTRCRCHSPCRRHRLYRYCPAAAYADIRPFPRCTNLVCKDFSCRKTHCLCKQTRPASHPRLRRQHLAARPRSYLCPIGSREQVRCRSPFRLRTNQGSELLKWCRPNTRKEKRMRV